VALTNAELDKITDGLFERSIARSHEEMKKWEAAQAAEKADPTYRLAAIDRRLKKIENVALPAFFFGLTAFLIATYPERT
jgi:hypothetical protein